MRRPNRHLRARCASAKTLLAYLSRPLPEPTALPEATVHAWMTDVAKHYFELRDRVAASGPMIIDLPPHLPLDRIGGIDGWHLTPLDTPFELRSLPPTAILPPAEVHRCHDAGPSSALHHPGA